MYFKSLALLALASATQFAAAADQAVPEAKTRAAVIAELQAARQAGELPTGDYGDFVAQKAPQGQAKTRAEVTAELAAARKAGDMPDGDYGDFVAKKASQGAGRTRIEVLKELADYVNSGRAARERAEQEIGVF